MLDIPRNIRFSNRSIQRVGQLESPLSLAEISSENRGQAALIQWVWGCLFDQQDLKAFATPEDLADVLPFPIPVEQVVDIQKALLDAWNLANPVDEKKETSSAPSPSPASS